MTDAREQAREALAVAFAKVDADIARDLGASSAELVGLAGKVQKLVHYRLADVALPLLVRAVLMQRERCAATASGAQVVRGRITVEVVATTRLVTPAEVLAASKRGVMDERKGFIKALAHYAMTVARAQEDAVKWGGSLDEDYHHIVALYDAARDRALEDAAREAARGKAHTMEFAECDCVECRIRALKQSSAPTTKERTDV